MKQDLERDVLSDFAPLCPACTWHSRGRGCSHKSNAPGGCTLRQAVKGKRRQQENRRSPSQSGADDRRDDPSSAPLVRYTTQHLALCLHYAIKFQFWPRTPGRKWSKRKEGWKKKRGDGVKHKSRSDHGGWRWEAGITETVKWRGAAAALACLLALVPKTLLSAAHMSPSGTTGEGKGGEWVQLGDRGLLEGAAAACQSAHWCRSHSENVEHTNEQMSASVKKINGFVKSNQQVCDVEREVSLQTGHEVMQKKKKKRWWAGPLQWSICMWSDTCGSRSLPQHCANDRPRHETSETQVQSEKASGHSWNTQTHMTHKHPFATSCRIVLKPFIWFHPVTQITD